MLLGMVASLALVELVQDYSAACCLQYRGCWPTVICFELLSSNVQMEEEMVFDLSCVEPGMSEAADGAWPELYIYGRPKRRVEGRAEIQSKTDCGTNTCWECRCFGLRLVTR
jgi:hypothetical protein